MTPAAALKYAWTLWFVAVAICAGAAGSAMVVGFPTADRPDASVAAIAFSMAVFAVLIPVAWLAHWYCFRWFWKDGVVQPHGFLLAYALLWAGLTLTVIILSIVSMMQALFLPAMLTLAAILLLLLTWPSGWAMVYRRSRREEDDEESLKMPEHPGED